MLQEAFTEIPLTATDVSAYSHYVVNVGKDTATTAIVKRNEYAFKLVATKNGQTAEKIIPLNTGAFQYTVDFSLSQVTSGAVAYNTIQVEVSGGLNFTPVSGEDFTLEIYRRKASDPHTAFTQVNSTQQTWTPYSNSTYTYTDNSTSLVVGTDYVYRVVAKQGTTTLVNTGTDEIGLGGSQVRPATPTQSFTISGEMVTAGSIPGTSIQIPAKSLYGQGQYSGGQAVYGLKGAPALVQRNGTPESNIIVGEASQGGTYYYYITIPTASTGDQIVLDYHPAYTVAGSW